MKYVLLILKFCIANEFVVRLAQQQEHGKLSDLLYFQKQIDEIDKSRLDLEITSYETQQLDQLELDTSLKALNSVELNLDGKDKLNEFAQTVRILCDVYFRIGHLLLTSEVQFQQQLPENVTVFEAAYEYINAAAILNHKQAKFVTTLFLENGIVPHHGSRD